MTEIEKRIAELSGVPSAKVRVYDTIDSTSTEARRRAESGGDTPALILAEHQSAGRGRMGRGFYSPAHTGLYMTALFEATESLVDTVFLTTAASVSVAKAIDKLTGTRTEIKWVNDIYLGGKKICGILCESYAAFSKRYVAVGVGVNLSTEDFPEELVGIADSLRPDRDIKYELAAEIFGGLYRAYLYGDKREMIEYYKERSFVLGKRVVFCENGVSACGVACDVDELGRLSIRLDDGNMKLLSSGEISLRTRE